MSSVIKNIFRFFLFLLIQVYVLNHVPPLHHFFIPYLYFLFLLWLPFSINRFFLLMVSFAYGFILDAFTGSYGMYTAPCVLIGYVRPFVLNLLIPQETSEQSFIEPSSTSMGTMPYVIYITILTLLHHTYLVLIEWLQVGNFLQFLGKVIGTTIISLLLIFATELLFFRNAKYRNKGV